MELVGILLKIFSWENLPDELHDRCCAFESGLGFEHVYSVGVATYDDN